MKFDGNQRIIFNYIDKTSPPGKYSAKNAIRHIKKAWSIKDIDPEMAFFRSITAEEEAATAIFHAIKKRAYEGSDKINHRDHVQKAAVFPFLGAISQILVEVNKLSPELLIYKDNNMVEIRLQIEDKEGNQFFLYPKPPLNWSYVIDNKIYDFSNEINMITKRTKVKSIIDHIRKLANLRNKLLYASDKGIYKYDYPIEIFIQERLLRIYIYSIIFILIDIYSERQQFVQQCVIAFLKMLKKMPRDIKFE